MNLWDKSLWLRQLFVVTVALFFFSSCEDPTSLLGFKNPNKKFDVAYIEIPIESSVLAIDSIITDNATNASGQSPSNVLVGQYQDPLVGKITAQSFVQFYPSVQTTLDPTAVYDSIVCRFHLNFYGYGFTGKRREKFNIYELTGDSLSFYRDNTYGSNRYFSNTIQPYSSSAIGEAAVNVDYDSLLKQASLSTGRDTLVAHARLNDTFGSRLFNVAKNDPNATLSDFRNFKYAFKGLALVPSESAAVLGINILSPFSEIILYYHTLDDTGAVKDKLGRVFYFNTPSFTNISADRSSTELASLTQPFQNFTPPSGMCYVQSGSPIVTKLDLKKFYAFVDADTNTNVIINSAELVIEDVESPAGLRVHSAMVLGIINNTGQLANFNIAADREAYAPYYVALEDSKKYFAYPDVASQSLPFAGVVYSSDNKQFSGFVTLFAQSLFKNRKNRNGAINEKRINFLHLSPYNSLLTSAVTRGIGSTVTRTVFDSNKIKLRIYYTRALATP